MSKSVGRKTVLTSLIHLHPGRSTREWELYVPSQPPWNGYENFLRRGVHRERYVYVRVKTTKLCRRWSVRSSGKWTQPRLEKKKRRNRIPINLVVVFVSGVEEKNIIGLVMKKSFTKGKSWKLRNTKIPRELDASTDQVK